MPVVMAVLMGIGDLLPGACRFVTSPFETLRGPPAEGRGLNPLLQNFYMQIHPPLLYLGYVGLSIPFAFAIAALVTRKLDTAWITSVRRWTIVSWLFLGIGILLGARGPTRRSAGAATGPGTRSRTRPSCRGWSPPPSCTR